MREFLYSEIANFYQIQNVPLHRDVALEAGRHLCETLLEPLNETFGRIGVRSGYRSPTVNAYGNENRLNCASNEKNFAFHIWEIRDRDGGLGAAACIVIPWFLDRLRAGGDWRAMAYWIHDHLPYSGLEFFASGAFNISWHEKPKRTIHTHAQPTTFEHPAQAPDGQFASFYEGFPRLGRP